MNRSTFVETLTADGFASATEIAAVEKQIPQYDAADAQPLARALAQTGKLTKFQAAALYQGRGKSLIYGDYVVLDRVGAGGMGQVFKARHRRMDRLVALKVMSQTAMKSPDSVKRFEREVKAAAKLTHPNIVHAYDAGVQDGVYYLVMELVDGADLSSLLKKHGKLGLKQGCGFIAQAARGFAAAHAKGVVHRDIKPGNLLVDREGNVKVLDMGLARFDDGGVGGVMAEGELTEVGAVMGTVDYMAPEQALNTRHADAKSDVYGLGCTLYRVITGESVFAGETLVEKVLAHREQPIPSLRRVRPDAPAVLDQLLSRMLAKKPQDRPTMQEVADRLAALDFGASGNSGIGLSGALPQPSNAEPSGIGLAPAPVFPGAPTFSGLPPPPRAQVLAAAPPRKRSNLPLLAIAGGGALLVCFGIWVYIKDQDGNTIAAVQVPEQGSVSVVSGTATPAVAVSPAPKPTNATPLSATPPLSTVPAPLASSTVAPVTPYGLTQRPSSGVTAITPAPQAPGATALSTAVAGAPAGEDQVKIFSSQAYQRRPLAELFVTQSAPDYLRDKTPFLMIHENNRANVTTGGVGFRPTRSGPLYMAVSWNDDGAIDEKLRVHIMDDAALQSRGWKPVGQTVFRTLMEPPLPQPLDEPYTVYVKNCVAGENLAARTRKYRPPVFFLTNSAGPSTAVAQSPVNEAHPAAAPPRAVTDPASERATALAVLAKQGRIKVRVGGQFVRDYIDVPASLPTQPFELVEVSFYNIAAAGDQDLALIRNATAIEILVLNNTQVTDQGLAALRNLKQLRTIKLAGTQVRGPGLVHLAGLTQLRDLIFADRSVDDSVAQTIGMLPQLEHFELVRTQVSNFSFLRSLPNVTNLNFGGSPVRDLAGFETLSKLKTLALGRTEISDEDVPALQNLISLETLNLSETNVTDASVPYLEKLTSLKMLNLKDTYVTGAGAARLRTALPPQCNLMIATRAGSPPPPTRAPPPIAAAAPSAMPTVHSALGAALAPAVRVPVPDAAAQQKALALVKEVFQADYAAAKTPEQKAALAAKLTDQANQTQDDPASRYVLLNEARTLALDGASAEALQSALQSLIRNYEVAASTTLVEGWTALTKRPRVDPSTFQLLFNEASIAFDEAVIAAKFDDAKRFGDFALTITRRLSNAAAETKETTQRNAALAVRQKEWPGILAAAEKLSSSPDDAEANLTLARYRALVENDWPHAFPLYAKCGEEVLAKLATKSIGVHGDAAAQSAAQTAMGDEWWNVAQVAKAPQRPELLAAADYWYGLAAPGLSGLQKSRVDKRVAEIEAAIPARILPATRLPQDAAAAANPVAGSSAPPGFDVRAMPVRGGLGDAPSAGPPRTLSLGGPASPGTSTAPGASAAPGMPTSTPPVKVVPVITASIGPVVALPPPKRNLQPGLGVREYAAQPNQIDRNLYTGWVEPADLGNHVGNPYVVSSLDWKYDVERNAIASGFIDIQTPGEYTFRTTTHFARGLLYINGAIVNPFRQVGAGVTKVVLPRGLLSLHSYAFPYTRGVIKVEWIPPGQTEFTAIPSNLLFYDTTGKLPPLPPRKPDATTPAN
ncbi:MAG: hypothetical protein C0483_04935 [Pirellula sp.]|nr:hypothetical protein [Pirellula sp.]